VERHFAATAYLVNSNKLIFIWHKKLNSWLPPGGHVEPKEAPHEAVIREIYEETGITDIIFFENKPLVKYDYRTKSLPEPYRILEETISEDHFHIDFIYFAETKQFPLETETKVIMVTKEELKILSPIFENVRILGLEALEKYEKRNVDTA